MSLYDKMKSLGPFNADDYAAWEKERDIFAEAETKKYWEKKIAEDREAEKHKPKEEMPPKSYESWKDKKAREEKNLAHNLDQRKNKERDEREKRTSKPEVEKPRDAIRWDNAG